jgi:ADP-ribose pyrophosphatase YjhB (NUDIX family)
VFVFEVRFLVPGSGFRVPGSGFRVRSSEFGRSGFAVRRAAQGSELVISRQYPDRPFVGVGAVIVDGDRVVLVRRRFEPLAGRWTLPGGAVEAGETLPACVAREMREETDLAVAVGPVIDVFDRITRDADGRVQYHYVLVDYVCWPTGGELRAGSDVDAAVWVHPSELAGFAVAGETIAVIERGLELVRSAGTGSGGA